MLSSENPSDSSCPCKASAVRSDKRASDELSFQQSDPAGLGEIQAPHFSIRDYVFKSRSKNIAENWPFSQDFLQICLKHGVQDLLPPFEPPTFARPHFSGEGVVTKQLVACPEVEQVSTESESLDIKDSVQLVAELSNIGHVPSDGLVLGCSNQYPHELLETKLEIDRRDTSDVELIDSEAEPQKISGTLKISHESLEKKCTLIVKLGTTSKTSEVEDIASSCNTHLDPMASKVCPVCRTFTSTSNTTLNAHIDQCLSLDSNSKFAVTKFSNIKMKRRKKRLMVDIYATTSACTLEDLDRRNGTNWAADLAMLTQRKEADTEIKRQKFSSVCSIGGGEQGEVCVDSDGTKLLILSKFDSTSALMSRMHLKEIKGGRSSLIGKKKCLKPKYTKYMKVNPHGMKLSSLRSFKIKNQVEPERECHAATHQEESSLTHVSNAQDQVKSGQTTLRQWVSSKRSIVLKKISDNNIHKISGKMVLNARKPIAENNKPELSETSFMKSNTLRLASSNELATLKTKGGDILYNVVPPLNTRNNNAPKQVENISSASCVMLKLSGLSGSCLPSSRSKREEITSGTTKKSDSFSSTAVGHSESCRASVKAKKHSIFEKKISLGRPMNLEVNKVDGTKKYLTSKRLPKQRLLSMTGDQKLGSLSDESRQVHSSNKGLSLGSGNASKISRTHQSNLSENATSPNPEENIDQMSISQSNNEASEQQREGSCASRRSKHTLTRLHVGVEHHSLVTDMQIEATVCENIDAKSCKEKALSAPVLRESLIVENSTLSMEGHLKSMSGSQAPVKPVPQNSTDEQEIHPDDVSHDGINSQNTELGGDVVHRVEDGSHKDQNTEYWEDNTAVQELSTCFIGHDDMELGIPQEISKLTSRIVTPNIDNSFHIDRELSGSPGSAASTISHPSPADRESKDLGEEPRPAATSDKLGPSLLKTIALPSSTSTRETMEKMERDNQETKQPEKFPHFEPCCCSRRESLSHEPQLSRQSFMAGMMLPLKGKQMSSTLCMRSSIFFSSDACPCLRTDATATTHILESPTESIITKASFDPVPASPFSREQAQANSNPVLRLMGKNLVVNTEFSSVEPPKVSLSNLEKSTSETYLTSGHSSTESVSYCNSFSYHHGHLQGGSPLTGLVPSKGTSSWSASKNSKPNQNSHQKRMNKKPISSSLQSPYLAREMMVTDDSPHLKSEQKRSHASPAVTLHPLGSGSDIMLQRALPCLPSQNQFVLRESPNVVTPLVSFPHPRMDANITNHGSLSEGSVLHLGSPFTFLSNSSGSASHTTPTMYYSSAS